MNKAMSKNACAYDKSLLINPSLTKADSWVFPYNRIPEIWNKSRTIWATLPKNYEFISVGSFTGLMTNSMPYDI